MPIPKKPGLAPAAPARKRVRRGSAEDAQALRAELLASAMALFAAKGLDGVTMRAVAQSVGVSVMTPYRYFADKAELLRGLWQSVLRAACDRMRAAVDAQQAGGARQRALIDAFVGYWEDHPDHFRLVYQTDRANEARPNADRAAFAAAPVYGELLQLAHTVTLGVATEIGAAPTHAKLAGDIRFAMMMGYLQAALVNKRYRWSDMAVLRATFIEEVMGAVERVLRNGPAR